MISNSHECTIKESSKDLISIRLDNWISYFHFKLTFLVLKLKTEVFLKKQVGNFISTKAVVYTVE